MWEPDGWEATTRVGVLVPQADVGPESELSAMAPASIGIHATRVPFAAMAPGGAMDPTIPLAPVRAFAEPPFVDDAAESLASAPVDVIAFGFTSSAYVIGARAEAAMIDRLSARTRGIPVVATCAGAVSALSILGVSRVALFSPPWFDEGLNLMGARYYGSAGFDVVAARRCELPSDQRAISPGDLHAWVSSHTPDHAEAVVVSGNGFRAVGAISALERDLGRPVLTANQVLLWAALSAARADTSDVLSYGRIFRCPSVPSADSTGRPVAGTTS